jgi:hypothetical protein
MFANEMEKTMKKLLVIAATAALAAGMASASWAAGTAFSGDAVLAKAVDAPTDTVVDGVSWHCDGSKCAGKAERRSTIDSQMKECRRVAATLGALAEYSSRGRPMSKSAVETCNRLAAEKAE